MDLYLQMQDLGQQWGHSLHQMHFFSVLQESAGWWSISSVETGSSIIVSVHAEGSVSLSHQAPRVA